MVWSSRTRPHHGFSILCSAIKIDADGSHAIQAQYNFGHHVNMQLIKIPTTSYVNATQIWGHDFKRNREGYYPNPWANSVEPSVNGITHKAVNYLFCLLCPIIYLFQKLVEVVNALGMEEYGSKILIGEATHFWKIKFWLMGQVITQKLLPKPLFTHAFFSLT